MFQKRKGDAEEVIRRTKQFPRDEVCARRARCKDDSVGASVVTSVTWDVVSHFCYRSDGNSFCALGSVYKGTNYGTSVLNGQDWVSCRQSELPGTTRAITWDQSVSRKYITCRYLYHIFVGSVDNCITVVCTKL